MAVHYLAPWKRGSSPVTHDGDVRSLRGMQREIDSLFDNFFRGTGLTTSLQADTDKMLSPNIDIMEDDKGYHLALELPGVAEEDVDISLTGEVLTIKGEKKAEKEEGDKQFHRMERSYGSFQRSITLPSDVKEDAIEARFNNGVLTVEIPKLEEQKPKVKKIGIKKK